MGNAGTGHGVGNTKEVSGDNTVGYVDKSTDIGEKAFSTSTNSNNFITEFGSYAYTNNVQQDNVINADMVINLNRINIGGNGNINVGQGNNNRNNINVGQTGTEEGKENSIPIIPPQVHLLEIGAYNLDLDKVGKKVTQFSINVKAGCTSEFDFSNAKFSWSSESRNIDVLSAFDAGSYCVLHCKSTESIPFCLNVFGSMMVQNCLQKIPFHGIMIADAGFVEDLVADKSICVGEAHGPHRMMINHPDRSQAEWNKACNASMNICGWSTLMSFKAFSSKKPGMIRIAIGVASNPHRVMINHKDRGDWNADESMTIAGWTHHMDFWAFPSKMPGTIRIVVGEADNPHRAMINHRDYVQQVWNDTQTMNFSGWKQHMEFWAYP